MSESRIEEVRRLAAIGTVFEEPRPEPPARPCSACATIAISRENVVTLSAVRKARRQVRIGRDPDAA
jgi:hypothetical protein